MAIKRNKENHISDGSDATIRALILESEPYLSFPFLKSPQKQEHVRFLDEHVKAFSTCSDDFI